MGINVFWMINRNTFFRSIETSNAVYINGYINIFISIVGIAIICSSSIVFSKIRYDLILGINLLILYNLVPLLLQQKSMFGIFIVIEIVFTIYFSKNIAKNILDNSILKRTIERIITGLILTLFAFTFLSRSIILLIKLVNTHILNNDISVGISDLFICSVWLFVGFSLVINKSFGKRFVYSIYINGMLLYVTLIIYLIMYPIVTNTKLDQSALMVIIAMSLFFIIPFILLTIKKLTTAST